MKLPKGWKVTSKYSIGCGGSVINEIWHVDLSIAKVSVSGEFRYELWRGNKLQAGFRKTPEEAVAWAMEEAA